MTQLSDLGLDELQAIVSQLTVCQRLGIERTNHGMKEAVRVSFPEVRQLTIYKNKKHFSPEDGEIINSVFLDASRISDLRNLLKRLRNLRSLSLESFHTINEDTANVISQESQLDTFKCIFPFGLSGGPLKCLALGIPNLKRVELRMANIIESDLRLLIRACQQLEYLDVTGNHHITGDCLFFLGPAITTLNCSRCTRIGPHGILRLVEGQGRGLKSLQTDLLGQSDEMDAKLQIISAKLSQLEILNLRSSYLSTDYDIVCISKLTKLKRLIIIEMGPMVTDEALLRILNNCKHLVELELDLSAGRGLDLVPRPPTDASLSQIGKLIPRLEELTLRNAKHLTQRSLIEFATLQRLWKVQLKGMPITDEDVTHLMRNAPRLRSVSLTYCKKITPGVLDAAIEVAQRRPQEIIKLQILNCLADETFVCDKRPLPRNLVFTHKSSFRMTFL